ncbi:mycofactocin system glycosyltransferase [Burkholderia sp. Ax-1719]|nr:mycofactocin system glycosyltransferase [Burkholderia sp. Ax-1719]
METLPRGFSIRVRDDVKWRVNSTIGEKVLIGGSPRCVMRLSARAMECFDGARLTVCGERTAALARRLLDRNVADPVDLVPLNRNDLTVVIPVRNRHEQLERCLAALRGLSIIVVDDASHDAHGIACVAKRYGARVVALPTNRGPAAARNAGLAEVATKFVAFVDSDVVVEVDALLGMSGHFVDPAVALVGPMVHGATRGQRPRWYERYDAAWSSLTLGHRPCSVAVGAAVGWLPSACLVGRVSALREPNIAAFAEEMRVGEDVDLVLRLLKAGWVVRYAPEFIALHDARTAFFAWLERKVVYGTGGAPLARKHGVGVAAARIPVFMAIVVAATIYGGIWGKLASVVGVLWTTFIVFGKLPPFESRLPTSLGLAVEGFVAAVLQATQLILRHWWPAAIAMALFSTAGREAILFALLIDSLFIAFTRPPVMPNGESPPNFLVRVIGRRLDDMAYGAGLWLGAVKHRTTGPLAIEFINRRKQRN